MGDSLFFYEVLLLALPLRGSWEGLQPPQDGLRVSAARRSACVMTTAKSSASALPRYSPCMLTPTDQYNTCAVPLSRSRACPSAPRLLP
jgi:hypothetical protein